MALSSLEPAEAGVMRGHRQAALALRALQRRRRNLWLVLPGIQEKALPSTPVTTDVVAQHLLRHAVVAHQFAHRAQHRIVAKALPEEPGAIAAQQDRRQDHEIRTTIRQPHRQPLARGAGR